MTAAYRIAIKESAFRETPLPRDEFDDDVVIQFTDETEAEQWVDEQNQLLSSHGKLTIHTAHPNDSSDVNAYLVFKPQGSGQSIERRISLPVTA